MPAPQDPRRVLWLAKGLGRGGAERLIVDAAALLDRERYDVEVAYLLPWKDALVPDLRDAGVPVHCLGQTSAYDLRWVPRLRRLVAARQLRPGPHPGPGPGRRRADGAARAPAPTGAHRAQRLGPVPLADVLDQRPDVLPQRPRHRGVGGGGEQRPGPPGATPPRPYAGRGRPPRHPAGQQRCADRRRPASRPAATLDLPTDAPVVGTVGNLTAKKDQSTLLRAFAILRGDRPDARLVVVGAGVLEDQLRREARPARPRYLGPLGRQPAGRPRSCCPRSTCSP